MVHGSRLRFFRNKHYNVTEDVEKFTKCQQEEYMAVKDFLGLRHSKGNKEVLVSYLEFDDEEPKWTSLVAMFEDVPERLLDALRLFKQQGCKHQQALAEKFLQYLNGLSQ